MLIFLDWFPGPTLSGSACRTGVQWTTHTMEYLNVTIEYIKNIVLGKEKKEKVEEEIFCWQSSIFSGFAMH